MRFSAKLFALVALSVYKNSIETVKTLSFFFFLNWIKKEMIFLWYL